MEIKLLDILKDDLNKFENKIKNGDRFAIYLNDKCNSIMYNTYMSYGEIEFVLSYYDILWEDNVLTIDEYDMIKNIVNKIYETNWDLDSIYLYPELFDDNIDNFIKFMKGTKYPIGINIKGDITDDGLIVSINYGKYNKTFELHEYRYTNMNLDRPFGLLIGFDETLIEQPIWSKLHLDCDENLKIMDNYILDNELPDKFYTYIDYENTDNCTKEKLDANMIKQFFDDLYNDRMGH